ncbi:hypothetical protein H2204_006207 [Knufia peltigerae]|uniref:polynucleotide adenylyltransferase n=1 Tax=Knufia peltigerae TaxID=1002370 RepID=A0AA38Y5G9_9EURO|nr:hypothetical protein H2204_006207 [Knufia peltigerae]
MKPTDQNSGFDDHVWGQLQNMAHQPPQRGRGGRGNWGRRGQGRNHRGYHSSQMNQSSFINHQTSSQLPPAVEDFPPLGSNSAAPLRSDIPFSETQPPQLQTHPSTNARRGTAREYQDLARGNSRGRGGRYGYHTNMPPTVPSTMIQYSGYGQPHPRQPNLYHPHSDLFYGIAEQQRHMRHVLMKQSDYLRIVAHNAHKQHRLTPEEYGVKEKFRCDLEMVAKDSLGAKYPELDAGQIRLKCYGSLANGFALANCDMDLLLALPSREDNGKDVATLKAPADVDACEDSEDEECLFNVEVRRVLEKAFLDRAYGARLLTNTRVPILRVCERPSPELLHNLREYRATWEKSSFQPEPESSLAEANEAGEASQDQIPQKDVPAEKMNQTVLPDTVKTSEVEESALADVNSIGEALRDLKVEDASSQKPAKRTNPNLEFVGDCGIQCDVNFTNFVAVHNSHLLWTYQSLDSRVGDVGTFVKIWAKARDINTPYRGTLSSYGYILMVLHYLMNVASPPVIPNLQYLAKTEDSWYPDRKIELFDGFDIRFLSKPGDLKHLQEANTNKNKESSSQLLRGFFRYYATREGFFWTRDVISIRQPGGILPKAQKGWTEAKWVEGKNKSVRLRYLLAIEDPFEIEHNVARTVGHNGLVSIRDEFRRAWNLLERVGAGEQIPSETFLEPVTDRVDTLRKDQEFHRQKQLRQMKQDLDEKEKTLLEQKDKDDLASHTDGMLGISVPGTAQSPPSPEGQRRSSSTKLTSTLSSQAQLKRRQPWRRRFPTLDSDSESDADDWPSARKVKPAVSARSESENSQKTEDKEMPTKSGYVPVPIGDVLLANGRDAWGNLVAWDIDTQDGRWLHWRDNKIKDGTFRGFSRPSLQELDVQCPFDPKRPSPYSEKPYNNHIDKSIAERPPWPLSDPSIFIPITTDNARRASLDLDPCPSVPCNEQDDDPSVQIDPNPKQDQPVGQFIPWDTRTSGGRWLRSRDARIVKGTWRYLRKPSGPHAYFSLDAAFPYSPSMTWKELEERNHLLRSYCAHRPWPLSKRAEFALKTFAEQIKVTYSSQETEPLPLMPVHNQSSQLNTQIRDTSSLETGQSSPESVHLKPGSSDSAPQGNGATVSTHTSRSQDVDKFPSTKRPCDDNGTPDQHALRARRLAFFEKQFAPTETDPDEYTLAEMQRESMHVTGSGQGSTSPQLRNDLAIGIPLYEITIQDKSDIEEVTEAGPSCRNDGYREDHKSSELRVPNTLFPDMDRTQRPRDEDLNIMAIPGKPRFRFDPRQLQDLDIIAKGGNGCARQGAEFNIEDEYEWSGEGMLGHGTSTELPYLSSGTPYEAGKGDEEGLLGELPGEID